MIFHIRRKLRKQKGNQFYKDYSDRSNGTYCGADMTDKDIAWNEKATPFLDCEPCQKCIEIRGKYPPRIGSLTCGKGSSRSFPSAPKAENAAK